MLKSHTSLFFLTLLILNAILSAGCSAVTPSPTPTYVPTLASVPTPTTNEQGEESQSPVEFVWILDGDDVGFTQVLDSAVDLEGNLLVVVESDEYRIMKFDPDGDFLAGWGGQGIGEGEFTYIPGVSYGAVAIDAQGNIFVTEDVNGRIQKFDSDGKYLTHWGSNGVGKGKVFRPVGVAVDGVGNVYVTDGANLVQKFTNDGKYLLNFGSEGSGDGQFRHPTGIEVDEQGYVYIADYENKNIQKFDVDGQFISSWETGSDIGTIGTPESIAIDGLGRIHVTDLTHFRVEVFTSDGESLWSWGSIGLNEGQFFYPTGLSIDPEGNIYINDPDRDTIQKFRLREE